MLACKHCSTPNSLDSTFCKKCGTAVPADQKREAAVQLEGLVEEGLVALNGGRTAEALAIADAAIATDPTHLAALHLKSAVHERRGEIADALESAERIVELNPDSELDRIKRNGLRSLLLSASTPVRPDRRIAFAAAAAAMVLVACAGVLVARGGSKENATTVATNVPASNAPVLEQPVIASVTPAVQAPTQNPAIPTAASPQVDTQILTPDDRRSSELPRPIGSGTNTSVRPMPVELPNGGLPPVDETPTPTPVPTPTQPKPKPPVSNGEDPDPSVLKPVSGDKPQEDPGQISISLSKGSPKRSGGSQTMPETRTNGTPAYAQVGTERFGLGDYAGAATNLEKAVAGGGDAVQLNLRLAQAYSHLGRSGDAASAYERSRTAAAAALKNGKGDRERLQAAHDAAEAGLRTVRGG